MSNLSNLQKIRMLRDKQGCHIDSYLKHFESDDLDTYYKTHKQGTKKVFPEEVI